MKKLIVRPGLLQGKIAIPPSKSHSHRALILGTMGQGKSVVRNLLVSPDTLGMMAACRQLGADISLTGNTAEIVGCGGNVADREATLDVGNSGIGFRFLTALAALKSSKTVVTGDRSVMQRPMQDLVSALEQLGANVSPGLVVEGPIRPGTATLDGCDSQPVSALLIASLFLPGTTSIRVANPGEKPWIEMTLSWLNRLGASVRREGYTSYTVEGPHCYPGFEAVIPGDFSSAAFPLAAAAVTRSSLTLHGLDQDDGQGDKKIVEILRRMGAQIAVEGETLRITMPQRLKGIEVDINDCIDTVTILAVLGCYAEGTTTITNAAVAREKECDRLTSIAAELKKMGADITVTADGLIVRSSPLSGADVSSHGDHRMAMSLAVAGLGACGNTTVEDVGCIAKTYPSFVQDFRKIGAAIDEQ